MTPSYIIIFEDGSIRKTNTCGEDILQGAEDGVLSVVDISEPAEPKEYIGGTWIPVVSI